MTQTAPVIHMFCGKIAAGKSTLAAKLAEDDGAVLISEDAWLGELFGDQMATPRDYMRFAKKLRSVLGPHIIDVLRQGVSVVLDFQANTIESRDWLRGLVQASGAEGRLHVLIPPDEVCLARLRARNAEGTHPFAPTEAEFHQMAAYFVPPTEGEGFTLVIHD